MKKIIFIAFYVLLVILITGASCDEEDNFNYSGSAIDHHCVDITQIPQGWIEEAKRTLHIGYGHTSHGSQITSGMRGLVGFANNDGKGLSLPTDIFEFNSGGTGGTLDLRDTPFSGANDLGNPDRVSWATATRNYLDEHQDINVIIWSWCSQVSNADSLDIVTYLSLMNGLETDYPGVSFVYMTGHLDGTGEEGNLHQRNEQIRTYCQNNDRWLFDFADIESYDPDGNYYLNRAANDNCDYDSDGNGSLNRNWALDWQGIHTLGYDWYNCSAAHSQALNGNLKAYAAWWMWVRLAGWDGD